MQMLEPNTDKTISGVNGAVTSLPVSSAKNAALNVGLTAVPVIQGMAAVVTTTSFLQ